MNIYPAHIRESGEIQTVSEHCRGVADRAQAYLGMIGLSNTAYLSGLLHDAGKCSDAFSGYIRSASDGENPQKGSVIHSFAAVRFFLLSDYCHINDEAGKITSELLALAVGCHHGLFDCLDLNAVCGFTHRLQKQPEYDEKALSAFFSSVAEQDELTALFQRTSGEIGSVCDGINHLSANEEEIRFHLSMLARLLVSSLVDADRRDTEYFMGKDFLPEPVCGTNSLWEYCLDHYEQFASAFCADTPMQKSRCFFSEKCMDAARNTSGIYRLNLPTGGGKTLSGLRFALHHAKIRKKERIFFISPLLTILEQNADQIKQAIGDNGFVLEHHSDVVAEGRAQETPEKQEYLCETWDAPVIITTLVQFLNTLFDGRMSSVRRFHALVNSVIVIDEVQTVPPKMLSLFNSAINFLTGICKTTVVLCSATQPNLNQIRHPLLPYTDIIRKDDLKRHESVFKRNQISYKGRKPLADIPELISMLLADNQSVLVICNKKSQAAELYRVTEKLCDNRYHLSAGMCMAHRKEVLSGIRQDLAAPQKKVLCISTQVIESGVDISFDAVLRFSAGMDSIVQAAGRCNRNGEHGADSSVWVVDCADENLSLLKEIHDAKNAAESLLYCFEKDSGRFDHDLSSEKAVSFYYSKLYRSQEEGFFDYSCSGTSLYSMLSTNDTVEQKGSDPYFLRSAMKTAGDRFEVFEQAQTSIIVPWRDGADIISQIYAEGQLISRKTVERAKPYTVSVFSYQFEELCKSGAITRIGNQEIYALNPDYYDEQIGIITSKEGEKICSILIL